MGVNRIVLHNGRRRQRLPGSQSEVWHRWRELAGPSEYLVSATALRAASATPTSARSNCSPHTYHFYDNVTIIRGRHMIKTGGQLLRQQMNTFYAGNNGRTGLMNRRGPLDSRRFQPSGLGRSRLLPRAAGNAWTRSQFRHLGHRKTIYGSTCRTTGA